jgi:GAF domain-containing protein
MALTLPLNFTRSRAVRRHLLGVLSTHYPCPYRPPDEDLELIKRLGELMGQAIDASLEADGQEASLHFEELLGTRHQGVWRPMARCTQPMPSALR